MQPVDSGRAIPANSALVEALEADEGRDRYLAREGVRVLRFLNSEVRTNLEGVLQKIFLAATGQDWDGVLCIRTNPPSALRLKSQDFAETAWRSATSPAARGQIPLRRCAAPPRTLRVQGGGRRSWPVMITPMVKDDLHLANLCITKPCLGTCAPSR